MKMKIVNKDEAKTITFGTMGCLVLFAMLGVCIGLTIGVAVFIVKLIAG